GIPVFGGTGVRTCALPSSRPAAAPVHSLVAAGGAATARAPRFDLDTAFANGDDGFGNVPFPTARNANIAPPEEVAMEQDLEAIQIGRAPRTEVVAGAMRRS